MVVAPSRVGGGAAVEVASPDVVVPPAASSASSGLRKCAKVQHERSRCQFREESEKTKPKSKMFKYAINDAQSMAQAEKDAKEFAAKLDAE